MKIEVKKFNELNTKELYRILELRSEVFVVEQNCVYQDLDAKDFKALHIMGYINKKLVAYARALKPGDYFEEAGIGRVVVKANSRKKNLGKAIMKSSISAVMNYFGEYKIKVSAQVYLQHFYSQMGFVQIGKEYLEDNIPHVAMVLNN